MTHPPEHARAFARRLVDERLAACVNLHEVHSIYRWQAAVEGAEDLQLVLKSSLECIPRLEAFLHEEHPYDVPECIVLRPEHVEARYAAWLAESL